MNDLLYNVKGLAFGYHRDKIVLNDVDFSVRSSEFVALIGPNGAGKSTLLKLLAGLHKPIFGKIEFFDKPLNEYTHRALARDVAYLPQEDEIHFPFTVSEVVMLGRWPHSGGAFFDSPSDREAVRDAMERLGISQWADRRVTELSGGERARVMLAKALATRPKCLLLDEPVSEMDLKFRTDSYRLIRELANNGISVVVVAHDIGSVARWSDRMVLMAEGKIIADGPSEEVLDVKILGDAYKTGVKVIGDGIDLAVFASDNAEDLR